MPLQQAVVVVVAAVAEYCCCERISGHCRTRRICPDLVQHSARASFLAWRVAAAGRELCQTHSLEDSGS